MKIQLVGGQYHGECQTTPSLSEYIEMPPVWKHTISAASATEKWFPMERYQRQVYLDTGRDTIVAGESRRVFVYNGR